MDTDIHKQRRNLIGVSLGLVIYQLSGGKVEPISFLGGGIKLESGQIIICLAYTALAYLTWRYWLYAKPLHKEFRKIAQEHISNSNSYRKLITPLIDAFKNEGGVTYKEGWDAALGHESEEKYNPTPITVLVEHKFLSRKLHISVEDPKGDFHPENVTHQIAYIPYEFMRLRAYLSTMATEKTFSDLFIPYGLSTVAIVAAIFRALYA